MSQSLFQSNVQNLTTEIFIFNLYSARPRGFRQQLIKIEKFISLKILKPKALILVVGDVNNSNVKICDLKDVIPQSQMTFCRNYNNVIRQSQTDIFLLNSGTQYTTQFKKVDISDHILICCQIKLTKKLNSKIENQFNINKAAVYTINTMCQQAEIFEYFYKQILEKSHQVQISRRKLLGLQSIKHKTQKNFQEILKSIDNKLRTTDSKVAHHLINKLIIVNPKKREGGIMNCFIGKDNQLIIKQILVKKNILTVLGEFQGLCEYQPEQLPNLDPIDFEQFQYIQKRISQNKAITNVLISDTLLISRNGQHIILNDLWNQNTQSLVKDFGEFQIAPLLNKYYPQIPQVGEFRLITILSPLYKLIELRFEKALRQYCERKIIKQQVGFIRGLGTHVQILKLIQDIQKFKAANNRLVLFIDFKSAYNTANLDTLFQYMQEKQILEQKELQFLRTLMSNQYMQYEGVKYSFKNGVPQGSILSPYLFDIYTDLFISKANEFNLVDLFDHYYFYSDDLAIILEEKAAKQIIQALKIVSTKLGLIMNSRNVVY